MRRRHLPEALEKEFLAINRAKFEIPKPEAEVLKQAREHAQALARRAAH
jgi:hypothetical protein